MRTLIIKPTSACNFNCSFCSLGKQKIEPLKDFNFDVSEVRDIIITGGEPFLTPKSFFEDLIKKSEGKNISITSNLSLFKSKEFCIKWKDVLNQNNIRVTTSFQFGSKRGNLNCPFTLDSFLTCCENFKRYFNYVPNFISLIDSENESIWYKHIELAKRLNTICRLNNTLRIGNSNEYYPRWKMFRLYLKIIDLNEDKYELNCLNRHLGGCDLNTAQNKCWDNIDCYFGNTYHGYCEHQDKPLSFKVLKEECLTCELCGLCNNCNTQRNQLYSFGDIEQHCCKMLEIKPKLISKGFKI